MGTSKVKQIIVLSGKRKSGKDFVADQLVKNFGTEKCLLIRTSKPIKSHFAKLYGLDLEKMMTASNYKEKIRKKMVAWGEEQRKIDPYVFCKTVTDEAELLGKPIWIVSDCRRLTDIDYFLKYAMTESVPVNFVRVNSDNKTREGRGWVYTVEIDDAETECQLDAYANWDTILQNSDGDNVKSSVKDLCSRLQCA